LAQAVTAKLDVVLNLARPARRHLAASGAGRIVTVAAPTAREPDREMAAVSAARAAVASLTRSLALDLAADGILVNAVSVGLVDTARQRARYARSAVDEPYPAWLAAEVERRRVPLRRPGSAEEVARVVAFALSPALSYTTGSIIAARGGLPA